MNQFLPAPVISLLGSLMTFIVMAISIPLIAKQMAGAHSAQRAADLSAANQATETYRNLWQSELEHRKEIESQLELLQRRHVQFEGAARERDTQYEVELAKLRGQIDAKDAAIESLQQKLSQHQ